MITIEFNGLPGSGKTSLFRAVNQWSRDSTGYYLGPKNDWLDISNDSTVSEYYFSEMARKTIGLFLRGERKKRFDIAMRKDTFLDVVAAIKEFEELVQLILNARAKHLEDNELEGRSRAKAEIVVLDYFISLITFHVKRRRIESAKVVVYSEGFLRTLRRLLIDGDVFCSGSENKLHRLIPKVDTLFWIMSDPEVCAERLNRRKSGWPGRYREMGAVERIESLKADAQVDKELADWSKNHGINVIIVDNTNSLDLSAGFVIREVERILMRTGR